jgi:L-ascorbate metabolism protein UlaG (beta-lactamase superfamily)
LPKEISLAQSIDELYAIDLDRKDFAFIYAGYAGILLRTKDTVVALDPADLFSKVKKHIQSLDLITYSHSHFDHYYISDAVAFCKKTNATIVSEYNMVEELSKRIPAEKILSGPEEFKGMKSTNFDVNGIKVKIFRGVHPRPIMQLRVTIGQLRIFHAADSGYWPVGKQKVDVAFLPTGSPSPTCHPGVALAMAMDTNPTFAVAVHGNAKQCKKFKDLAAHELPETTVVVPKVNELVILTKP